MPGFLPDPVLVEIVAQGDSPTGRVRLTLPDGSSLQADLDLARLAAELERLALDDAPPVEVGRTLFDALLPGALGRAWLTALTAARSRGLRLSLRIDERLPEAHAVRWELLHYPQGESWLPLAASPAIYFSRLLPTAHPWSLPAVAGPLRVLVVISSPFQKEDNPLLYVPVDTELALLDELYQQAGERVTRQVLSGAVTAQQIADALRQSPGFDMLHYVGHGEYRPDEETGYLILTGSYPDGSQGPLGVSAAALSSLMASAGALPRLVFLAACESGQQSSLDAFTGVGPQLVQAGCPAVIAMQEKVEMAVARAFTQSFLSALLESGCVDLAVNRGRAALLDQPFAQWAVPALYLHLQDGLLFDARRRFRSERRQPYKYLQPYQRDDRDLFKGRAREAGALVERIRSQPVTVLYGEAGVGLTSLLEAGVRPALEADGWWVVTLNEYADICSEFRVQLQVDGRPLTLRISGDAPLADALRAASTAGFDCLALVLDQFERVLAAPEAVQREVLAALQAGQTALGDRLRLVFGLHQDALPALARWGELLGDAPTGWIELPALTPEEAVEAVIEPLGVLNWPVTVEPALVRNQLIPDLVQLNRAEDGDRPGVDPGQLQITCTWLYQHARQLQPPIINEELYLRAAGGADGILASFVSNELNTRFAGQSNLARQLLVQLAAPEMDRWVTVSQLAARFDDSQPADGIAPVLDQLAQSELLVRRWEPDGYRYAFANRAVAAEAVRLGGRETEQAYQARDELERAWRLWLADSVQAPAGSTHPDRVLPGRFGLQALAGRAEQLEVPPVRLLLLLRAAVLRGEPAGVWLDRLRIAIYGIELIASLETPGAGAGGAGASARELAGRLVGSTHPDLSKALDGNAAFGPLAWSAAAGVDPIDRQVAALALCALPDGLTRLSAALAALPPRRRALRTVELNAVLAEAGRPALPGSPLERAGTGLLRFFRRAARDGRAIAAAGLGAGVGAGLLLGLERLIVGLAAQSNLATIFFALFSYWGFLLIGLTGLFQGVAPALNPKARRPGVNAWLLGALGFGLANALVAGLNGIRLSSAPAVIPLGFLTGLALSWSLIAHRRQAVVAVLAGVLALVAAQAAFGFIPGMGAGLSISLSSGFFQVEFESGPWAGLAGWPQVLALLEAGLSGLALVFGGRLGRGFALAAWQRWEQLARRAGD